MTAVTDGHPAAGPVEDLAPGPAPSSPGESVAGSRWSVRQNMP
jgi:hypothetical protein